MNDQRSQLAKAMGPGLLFAGAAIGASHLVQSTRAGASFGLSLIIVVIGANVLKYPAFAFGPYFAAASRKSLLEGYRQQGIWALVVYALVTVLSMFAVQAAVTFVTAGLAIALLGVDWDPLLLSAVLLAACCGILAVGHYRWLDRVVKLAVALLTVSTLLATILVLPKIDWSLPLLPSSGFWDEHANLLFVAALIGWMPSAIDVSVWHSLWTLARSRDTGHPPSVAEAMIDFRVGYWATAVLGVCFVLLGAGVAYGHGATLPAPPTAFAAAVIGLYTEALGDWSRPIIGFSAFLVMFSTTLTVVDGFPRAVTTLVARFGSAEREGDEGGSSRGATYWITAGLLFLGSLLLLRQYLVHLPALVDLATSISLVTAPVLAWLNHRAIFGQLEASVRPTRAMLWASWVAIAIMTTLAAYYLALKLAY